MTALRRLLGALVGPSVILYGVAAGCEPQDIYLFDEPEVSPEQGTDADRDAGNDPAPPAEPSTDEPAPRAQPECTSEACERCVETGDCDVEATQYFCHPATGACKLPCDPEAAAERACIADERCDPELGLCVECVTAVDCGAATPACDPRRGECVECVGPSDCPPERPTCDVDAARCIECLSDADCSATGAVCLAGPQRCVQCRSDLDCSGLEEDSRCLPERQVCVECLVDGDCTSDPRRPFCSSENECEDELE